MHHNCTYQSQNDTKWIQKKNKKQKQKNDNQCIQNEYSEFVLAPN